MISISIVYAVDENKCKCDGILGNEIRNKREPLRIKQDIYKKLSFYSTAKIKKVVRTDLLL